MTIDKISAPFSLVSASITSGYLSALNEAGDPIGKQGFDVVNSHEDEYGEIGGATLQSPFTERWVGGHQHRHIDLNSTGNDNARTRPEAWHIQIKTSGIRLMSHRVYNSPPATLTREEVAKRSINIKNVLTTTSSVSYGNFRLNYEVVHSVGRKTNSFLKNILTGSESAGNIRTRFVSASNSELDNTRPSLSTLDGAKNKTIIVSRFNSPGGINESSRASLDVESEEMSPNIPLTYRNNSYRQSQTVRLSGSMNQGNSNNMIHGVNRNTLRKTSGIVQKDNFYVQRLIPRTDIQYMWITSSAVTNAINLGGYQSGSVSSNSRNGSFNDIIFSGENDNRVLNSNKKEFEIDFSTNTLKQALKADIDKYRIESYPTGNVDGQGFSLSGSSSIRLSGSTSWAVLLGGTVGTEGILSINYRFSTPISIEITSVDRHILFADATTSDDGDNLNLEISTDEGNTWSLHQVIRFGASAGASAKLTEKKARYEINQSSKFYIRLKVQDTDVTHGWAIRNIKTFPRLLSTDSPEYQFATWKQIRIGEHEVAKALRNTNRLSITDIPLPTSRTIGGYAVNAPRRQGIRTFIEPPVSSKYKPLRHRFIFKGNTNPLLTHEVVHTYNNNLSMFANKTLNDLLGVEEVRDQINDRLVDMYFNSDRSENDNPIGKFLGYEFQEVIYPKEENTGLLSIRGRHKYILDKTGVDRDGYDRQFGTQRAFWRDKERARFKNPAGSTNSQNHFVGTITENKNFEIRVSSPLNYTSSVLSNGQNLGQNSILPIDRLSETIVITTASFSYYKDSPLILSSSHKRSLYSKISTFGNCGELNNFVWSDTFIKPNLVSGTILYSILPPVTGATLWLDAYDTGTMIGGNGGGYQAPDFVPIKFNWRNKGIPGDLFGPPEIVNSNNPFIMYDPDGRRYLDMGDRTLTGSAFDALGSPGAFRAYIGSGSWTMFALVRPLGVTDTAAGVIHKLGALNTGIYLSGTSTQQQVGVMAYSTGPARVFITSSIGQKQVFYGAQTRELNTISVAKNSTNLSSSFISGNIANAHDVMTVGNSSDVFEILVYSSSLSIKQIADTEQYLREKWLLSTTVESNYFYYGSARSGSLFDHSSQNDGYEDGLRGPFPVMYRRSDLWPLLTQQVPNGGFVAQNFINSLSASYFPKPRIRYTSFLGGVELTSRINTLGTTPFDHPPTLQTKSVNCYSTLDSGLRYAIDEMTDKRPWFDSYEAYLNDIRGLTKDYSILPEFRISDNINYYVNQSGGNFRAKNNSFLSIDGIGNEYRSAISESSRTNNDFFKTYVNSDLIKNLDSIRDDNKELTSLSNILIKVSGIKKLLPYNGFYPIQRTVQLANLYSEYVRNKFHGGFTNQSSSVDNVQNLYLEVDTERADLSFQQTALEPLFSPGILYNSIKSGIAVDWPSVTGGINQDVDVNYGAQTGFLDYPVMELTPTSSVLSYRRKLDGRIPFEALIFPELGFKVKPRITSSFSASTNSTTTKDSFKELIKDTYVMAHFEPITKYSHYLGYYGDDNIGIPAKNISHQSLPFTYIKDKTETSPEYSLAMSNFLAETVKFFLSDEKVLSFNSAQQSKWKKFQAGKVYYLDIIMKKDPGLVMIEAYSSSFNLSGQSWSSGSSFTSTMNGRYFGYPIDKTYNENGYHGIATPLKKAAVEMEKTIHNDPAYAPYTPPYFEGDAILRLSFNPKETKKYTLDEIFSQITSSNLFPDLAKKCEPNSAAFANKMPIDSCVEIFGSTVLKELEFNIEKFRNKKTIKPSLAKDSSDDSKSIWIISPKLETPVLDFSAQPFKSHSGSYWLSSGFGRGMWSGYGVIPIGSKGIYLGVKESFPARINRAATGSLLEQVGFKSEKKKIGEIADSKEISEAVVVIPYLESSLKNVTTNVNGQFFIKIDRTNFGVQRQNVENGDAAIKVGNLGSLTEIQETSISKMIETMDKYVIPPQYNFMTFPDIPPFVMYIFEFKHLLDQQDLADIWQGLMPKIATIAELDEVEINHNSGKFEFFHDKELPQGIRWMVFKIKKKAEKNYFATTANSEDDEKFKFDFKVGRKEPEYGFNWPYDYFSLVEFAKVELSLNYVNKDLLKKPQISLLKREMTPLTKSRGKKK